MKIINFIFEKIRINPLKNGGNACKSGQG